MKLSDLSPKWIHRDLFVFKCPCCQKIWLSCKMAPMSHGDQFDIFEKEFGEDWNAVVSPCKPDAVWNIDYTDFDLMTVTPSIDASHSGHWHGFIRNGETT